MEMQVTLEGFAEFDQALAQLPKATGKNVLRRIARGALEPMANVAAAKAPVRSGRLAYSISVSEKRTARAQWQSGKWRSSPTTSITMAMGPAGGLGTLQYATFDEFGTVDTPAFAFMRAAWDSGASQALIYIINSLNGEIDRAVARRARRLTKQAV